MLFKLAFRNVRRQMSNYLIYFVTVSLTVALLFSVNNLIFSDLMNFLSETYGDFLEPVLLLVSGILSIIIAFVLSYATAFLLRRRKKEFGLYLTMGMTRGDILLIFAGETAVNFLFALGMGILLGLGIYHGLMAVFINFLEMEYTVNGYSAPGFLCTIGMVVVMFIIVSVSSLSYLKYAKMSRLLYGDKVVEKKVKHPALWVGIFFAAVAGLVCSVIFIIAWLQSSDFFERVDELIFLLLVFCASVALIPVSLSRTVVFFLLRQKKITARGTGIFTLRQFSGRLNANSVMIGVLTLLLTFAVVLPNIFFTMNSTTAAEVNKEYCYDVTGHGVTYSSSGYGFSVEEGLRRIENIAAVESSHIYATYRVKTSDENGVYHEPDEELKALQRFDPFVKESDFQRLCAMLGYTMPALNGGYLSCASEWGTSEFAYNSDSTRGELEMGGVSYSSVGSLQCPYNMLESFSWTVIPDEAVDGALDDGKIEEYPVRYLAVMLEEQRYDARAMYWALAIVYPNGNRGCGYTIKEYERLNSQGQVALFLLGDLFISAVFILLTMAMLALKMLSMLTEDREKYRILWRLGADEGMLRKTLFSQTFCFYFLPFALPLVMCIPLPGILNGMVGGSAVKVGLGAIVGQVAAFAGILLLLYALYFTLTYFIAWREVKKTVRAVG